MLENYRQEYNIVVTIGVSEEEKNRLTSFFPTTYTIVLLEFKDVQELEEKLQTLPDHTLFLMIHSHFFQEFSSAYVLIQNIMRAIPTVLLSDGTKLGIDERLFLRVLTEPIEELDITLLLRNLNARYSILMSRQSIDRERQLMHDLYTQKQQAFSFLIDCMKGIDTSSTITNLIENIRFSLESILPLNTLHFSVYNNELQILNNYIGINPHNNKDLYRWQELLQEEFEKATGERCAAVSEAVGTFSLLKINPESGVLISLPLKIHNKIIGLITMQLSYEPPLGKDLVKALQAMCSYVALAIHANNFLEEYNSSERKMISEKPLYQDKNIIESISIRQ